MKNQKTDFHRRVVISLVFTAAFIVILGVIPVVNVVAQEQSRAITSPVQGEVAKFGFIAAAIAFGFGAIGAGIGIAHVGAAAMGAISEKPEVAGQALIFIALAEGLVVFGFITALIILGRI